MSQGAARSQRNRRCCGCTEGSLRSPRLRRRTPKTTWPGAGSRFPVNDYRSIRRAILELGDLEGRARYVRFPPGVPPGRGAVLRRLRSVSAIGSPPREWWARQAHRGRPHRHRQPGVVVVEMRPGATRDCSAAATSALGCSGGCLRRVGEAEAERLRSSAWKGARVRYATTRRSG